MRDDHLEDVFLHICPYVSQMLTSCGNISDKTHRHTTCPNGWTPLGTASSTKSWFHIGPKSQTTTQKSWDSKTWNWRFSSTVLIHTCFLVWYRSKLFCENVRSKMQSSWDANTVLKLAMQATNGRYKTRRSRSYNKTEDKLNAYSRRPKVLDSSFML